MQQIKIFCFLFTLSLISSENITQTNVNKILCKGLPTGNWWENNEPQKTVSWYSEYIPVINLDLLASQNKENTYPLISTLEIKNNKK